MKTIEPSKTVLYIVFASVSAFVFITVVSVTIYVLVRIKNKKLQRESMAVMEILNASNKSLDFHNQSQNSLSTFSHHRI